MVSILARTRWGNKGKISQTVCELSVKNSWKHTVGWNLLEELQIEKKAEFLSSYSKDIRDQQTLLIVLQISSSANCSQFLWIVGACILLLYPHSQDFFLKKIICETLSADSMWIDPCTTCLKASKNEFSDSVMNEMKWKLLSDLVKTEEGSHTRAWTRLQKSHSAFPKMTPFWRILVHVSLFCSVRAMHRSSQKGRNVQGHLCWYHSLKALENFWTWLKTIMSSASHNTKFSLREVMN